MSSTPAAAAAGAGAGAGAGSGIPMSMSNTSMASRTPGNRDSMAYQNIPSEQYWSEPSRYSTGPLAPREDDEYVPKGKSNKKKWIIGGIILGVIALIAIVVGAVVSQTVGKSNGSGSSGSGSGSGNGSGDKVEQTDPNDPSTFTKDDRLHQSFWAMAYTPQASPHIT